MKNKKQKQKQIKTKQNNKTKQSKNKKINKSLPTSHFNFVTRLCKLLFSKSTSIWYNDLFQRNLLYYRDTSIDNINLFFNDMYVLF